MDALQILNVASVMVTFLLGEMPTRDEEQKHNLLLAASEHCRRYPDLKTVTLTCLCQSKRTLTDLLTSTQQLNYSVEDTGMKSVAGLCRTL